MVNNNQPNTHNLVTTDNSFSKQFIEKQNLLLFLKLLHFFFAYQYRKQLRKSKISGRFWFSKNALKSYHVQK